MVKTGEIEDRDKIDAIFAELSEEQLERLFRHVQVNVDREDMASDVLEAVSDAPSGASLFQFKWGGDIWLFVAVSEDDIPGIIERAITQ